MIRIAPPEDYGPLDEACARAGAFDWIVFASANAVDAFFERLLASPSDLRALGGVRLCAVGPATAERLARHGLKVDLTPSEYRAESLLRALADSRPDRRPEGAAAARRHRPRAGRRRAAQAGRGGDRGRRLSHGRRGSRARRRPGRLSHAPRAAPRRRHLHERVGGPELRAGARRRAGGRPAADDGRRGHRAGHGRGGGAVQHRDDDHAGALHDPALVDAIAEYFDKQRAEKS